ncbi:MAG TPA: histidine kinase, partial [Bacteroidales bacterium]|nr:histidine kinase [Bacteroidales bacterium]
KGNKQEILNKSDDEIYPYIRSISYHPDGYYWFGSFHGIARHDDENYRFYSSDYIQIKNTYSSDIDSIGNAWFGALEGLFYYDEKSDDFIPALPESENEVVKFVKVMDKDRILVGRLKDLLIINIHKYFANEKDAIKTLNQVDGYLGIEPKQNGVRKDSKGMYWIYCSNGVIRFDPDKLRTNPKPPDLYYTKLWVKRDTSDWTRYTSINNYDTIQIKNIQLSHLQNSIRIYFTAISTFKEERIQYRYKLSDGRESWSTPQSNNFVEFHQLKPGKYNLDLIASNGDGVWTPNPSKISFYIKPAFWQTTLFRVTAIMLFIILIVIITTKINRRIAIRKERQEAIVSDFNTMQMNQLIKQFDPHFTFNIISSIGALILSKETEKAYKYFTMLSRLLRSVLAKHTVFARTLEEEIELLKDYCSIQQYQLKDRFEYEIQLSNDVDTNFKIPKMLIQNFVENAIKHGINMKPGGGKIWITIMKNGNFLNIFIRDNGVGRKASAMHEITGTKSGTRITEQLFRLIEEQTGKKVKYDIIDLYDESQNPAGTEVILGFPVDLQL